MRNCASKITFDPDARTLSVRDNGIGMSRDEVVANIGTIARSGTRRYLEALSGEQQGRSQLIGQFGVGFYSAFVVADRVTVITRTAGAPVAKACAGKSTARASTRLETSTSPRAARRSPCT